MDFIVVHARFTHVLQRKGSGSVVVVAFGDECSGRKTALQQRGR